MGDKKLSDATKEELEDVLDEEGHNAEVEHDAMMAGFEDVYVEPTPDKVSAEKEEPEPEPDDKADDTETKNSDETGDDTEAKPE